MTSRSFRYRSNDSNNIWPGFVDVLATLLIVIIFILMVFTVSQIYLSDAISGRDKALQDLKIQINELSKILIIETKEKQQVLNNLLETWSKKRDTFDRNDWGRTFDFNISPSSIAVNCPRLSTRLFRVM